MLLVGESETCCGGFLEKQNLRRGESWQRRQDQDRRKGLENYLYAGRADLRTPWLVPEIQMFPGGLLPTRRLALMVDRWGEKFSTKVNSGPCGCQPDGGKRVGAEIALHNPSRGLCRIRKRYSEQRYSLLRCIIRGEPVTSVQSEVVRSGAALSNSWLAEKHPQKQEPVARSNSALRSGDAYEESSSGKFHSAKRRVRGDDTPGGSFQEPIDQRRRRSLSRTRWRRACCAVLSLILASCRLC